MNNTRLFADDVNNFFDINRSRNICTAVADKYSYSLHFSLTFLWMGCFLLSIFTECTHQKLLRSLIIQKSRNFIRRKIILSSLTDHGKTNCLDQFGRFYVLGQRSTHAKQERHFQMDLEFISASTSPFCT